MSWSLSQDLHGCQFISVSDLEDKALHNDLPLCLSPGAQDVPSICPSSPTSAQLHVLATSVIRSAAADPQPSITITDDLPKPTIHPGIYFKFYMIRPVVKNNTIGKRWSNYLLYCAL